MEYKNTTNNLPYTNRSWLENITQNKTKQENITERIPFTIEINLIRNVPNVYTNKTF